MAAPDDQVTGAIDSWLPAGLADRYDILARLGAGGMGVVYKARDRETGATVALKLIHPAVGSQPGVVERFKAELLLARQITHKNVCRVYDLLRFGDVLAIAMEFVEGERLRDSLARRQRFTAAEALDVTRQLIGALREAHAQGIVHRDLKPENIQVTPDGSIRLMDFGLARSTDSATTTAGQVLGTPAYMAPEQAEGKTADRRTDIYALGLIVYELLTGTAAFSGDSAITVAMKQVHEAPPRPSSIEASISPAMEAAILRALEKDPAKRYQTVDEFEQALTAAASGVGAVPVPAGTVPRTGGTVPSGGTDTGTGTGTKRRRWALAAGVVAVVAAGAAAAVFYARRPASIEVPFQRFTLDNGLRVVINEDHAAPTVSVAVAYNVGSRDERPGKTGLAHLFEHLMFGGSLNVGRGEHYLLVANNGGAFDGLALADTTIFFDTLPANQLDLALFLEADRMRSLAIDQDRLDAHRTTVLQERLFRVENQPYGKTAGAVLDTAYDNFAYKHDALGSVTDLAAVTVADVQEFFRVFYTPGNAVVSVAGDVRSDQALAQIRKYFGDIPKQPAPPATDLAEPEQHGERRRTVEDSIAAAPRLDIAFKTPPTDTPEFYATFAAGLILGAGQSSRLYQKLVRETEVAGNVSLANQTRRGPSLLVISIFPRPGKDAAQIEKLVYAEIDRLASTPVSGDELARIRLQYRRDIARQNTRTQARALELAQDESYYGRPELINTRARLIDRLTPAQLQQAAATYLTESRRSVVLTVPGPRTSTPPMAAPAMGKDMPMRAVERKNRAPVSNEVLRVAMPRPVEAVLDNGLAVIVSEDHRLPSVTLQLSISGAGSVSDPAAPPGLAFITAQMLNEGTKTRSSRQIAEAFENLGAGFGASAGFGSGATTISAGGLSDNFDAWFDLFADAALHPAFPVDQLNALKQRASANLQRQRSTAGFLATERFNQAVYGSHPARINAPTMESLDAMTADSLSKWYARTYAPQNAILTIAGDVSAARVIAKVKSSFGAWAKTDYREPDVPNPAPASAGGILLVDRPNAPQTTLQVGNVAIDRRNPDYLPVLVMNQLLGGDIAGRLSLELREQLGYTYNVSTSFTAFKYPGAWRVIVDVAAHATDDALRRILAQARRLGDEPVPAAELEAAKRALASRFALSLEDPAQQVSYAATRKIYGFSADYWDTYPAKVMEVSADEVRRVAKKYLNPDAFVIVAVGDRRTIEAGLAKIAPVQVFDAEGRPVR